MNSLSALFSLEPIHFTPLNATLSSLYSSSHAHSDTEDALYEEKNVCVRARARCYMNKP